MAQVNMLYQLWIESEALAINADGCSGPISGFKACCCLTHDLEYFYGRLASSAYRNWRKDVESVIDPWIKAEPITRARADANFRRCLQLESVFGQYSPPSWWRWLGVRLGGHGAWKRHREREKREAKINGT